MCITFCITNKRKNQKNFFHCSADIMCVFVNNQICDGKADCPSAADEKDCSRFNKWRKYHG